MSRSRERPGALAVIVNVTFDVNERVICVARGSAWGQVHPPPGLEYSENVVGLWV